MPVAKITKTFVDTTPFPTKGQVIYMDKDLPGFGVIFGTKVKTYIAQKDVQGRSIRCSIGRHGHFTPEEARKLARDKLHLMASGINPNQQAEEKQAKAITLEQTLESYLKTRKTLKSRTREDSKAELQTDYFQQGRDRGLSHRAAETMIGMMLKKLFPKLQDKRTSAGRFYIFPDLDECRRDFERFIRTEITWPADADDTVHIEYPY